MGFAYLCFSIIFAFCFPLCSGPLRRLRRHGCGTLLLLRASLRPRKRQTAAPAPLRLFLPQAAPQLRSPARVGGSPLSLAALAGVSPALPEGEPSLRPWAKENFVVRRSFFSFSLPQTLPKPTQVRLPPPRGRWHSALRCDGEGRLPRTRESENVTFRLGLPRVRGRCRRRRRRGPKTGPNGASNKKEKRPLAQALLV